MTPDEQAVYDSYPNLMRELLAACMGLMRLPLEEMLTANTRISLVGALVGPASTQAVDPAAAVSQRRLIEQAVRFRNELQGKL